MCWSSRGLFFSGWLEQGGHCQLHGHSSVSPALILLFQVNAFDLPDYQFYKGSLQKCEKKSSRCPKPQKPLKMQKQSNNQKVWPKNQNLTRLESAVEPYINGKIMKKRTQWSQEMWELGKNCRRYGSPKFAAARENSVKQWAVEIDWWGIRGRRLHIWNQRAKWVKIDSRNAPIGQDFRDLHAFVTQVTPFVKQVCPNNTNALHSGTV